MKRGRAEINTKISEKGFLLSLNSKSKIINAKLVYPKKIWQNYNQKNKEKLTRNLAYLLTLPFPLVALYKEIGYNTPKPELFEKFQQLMLNDVPSSTYEYKKQDPEKLKNDFLSIKFSFAQKKLGPKLKIKQSNLDDSKAILLLSMGKDSLLSLGISKEVGLNPTGCYINDTVSPVENKLKIDIFNRLKKEKIINYGHIITNSIEKLNDFETWNRQEMSFNYAHMVTGFNFIALPVADFYNSKYIIVGNEKNMDFFLKEKNKKIYPVYDQSIEYTKKQNEMINKFRNHKIFSIIRPITDIAVLKILHSRYPDIAKYQASCFGLDASRKERWCQDCFACTGTSLFLTAFGIEPKKVGLPKFFKKNHKSFYSLFNPAGMDVYDAICSKEQELLSFLFAVKNGEKGYVIDLFKKRHLKEALAREDELRKKYFRIYPSMIPRKIKPSVLSIYKEELKSLA